MRLSRQIISSNNGNLASDPEKKTIQQDLRLFQRDCIIIDRRVLVRWEPHLLEEVSKDRLVPIKHYTAYGNS